MFENFDPTAYKFEIVKSLRNGLAEIRRLYERAFWKHTLFARQWECFRFKEVADIDFSEVFEMPEKDHDKKVVERLFARKARRLLRRLQGD